MLKPMLAQKLVETKMQLPCFVQPKLNGVRALYQNGVFVSRDGHMWNERVLEHLLEALKDVPKGTILDGELYVHGWPLQKINSAIAVKRNERSELTHLVEYHVFDIVGNGSFLERLNWLMFVGTKIHDNVQVVPTSLVTSKDEADELYVHYVEQGFEGTMHRHIYDPYSPGKRVNWLLKRKDWHDAWFEVRGVVEGLGKHEGRLGALVCWSGTDRNSTFNVGTGFSDLERDALWANPPMGKQCHVKYLTKSLDNIPLHPVFLELR